MSELVKRTTICELRNAGKSPTEIILATGYAKATVYRVVNNFDLTGKFDRSSHSPRKDRKRTPCFIKSLKKSISKNPTTSMKTLAKRRNVSRRTISRAVNNDLGMRSYVRSRKNILTTRSKVIREERCPKLLNHLKNKGGKVRIFVDEKKFVVDEVSNRQNSRVIAYDSSQVHPVMRSKNPASVMVFAAVASDGKFMPPHFIEAGLKINAVEYLKILKHTLLPWIDKHYDRKEVMLIQDNAPAHGAKIVQAYLENNLPLFVPKNSWPSSSPDLNVCDYWLFSVIEEKSNATPHNNISSLKKTIIKAFKGLDPEALKKSCSSFRKRIACVIEQKGGHIE